MAKDKKPGRILKPVKAASGPASEAAIDRLIADLYFVLPCTTRSEAAIKLSKRQRRTPDDPVLVGDVDAALTHLRRNARKYGWTVPHVKRSAPGDGDKGRYFSVLINDDGTHYYDDSVNRTQLLAGAHSTMMTTKTQHENAMMALSFVTGALPPAVSKKLNAYVRKLIALSSDEQELLGDLSAIADLAA